ncbi:hypothetical protein KM043_016991 [Ampulex compressa]|nr:hypothetical protein KM043_016991 [Ampulex compressa]
MQLIDFIKMLRPCEDIVESCFWDGEKRDCADVIRMSHSTRGICCSFNYLLEDHINLSGNTKKPTPIHSHFYGPTSGLAVVLKEELLQTNNVKIGTNSEGVTVSIHHNLDYPGSEIITRILQKGQELQLNIWPYVNIRPSGLYHHEEGGKIKPECVHNDQEQLKYLPKYRYANCYVNCRMEAMLQICGCLPYEYDPVIKKHALDSCTLDGVVCITENYNNIHIVTDVYKSNFTCSCLNLCKYISYSVVPIKTTIKGAMFSKSSIYQNVSQGQAVLRVYMNSQTFTVEETLSAADELYFLASVGGIFSLFLGCSFLSAAELVYFGFLICRALSKHRV